MCMCVVCVSDPPPASAHVSVGCVRPLLHLSWCQTDSRGEPTHGKGRPEPSAEEHMLRASAFQPRHPPTAHTPHHGCQSCQATESHGPDYWQILPSITLFCTSNTLSQWEHDLSALGLYLHLFWGEIRKKYIERAILMSLFFLRRLSFLFLLLLLWCHASWIMRNQRYAAHFN